MFVIPPTNILNVTMAVRSHSVGTSGDQNQIMNYTKKQKEWNGMYEEETSPIIWSSFSLAFLRKES